MITPLVALLLQLAPAMADESVMGIEPVVVRVDDDVCVDRAGLVALVELRAGVGSVVDEGPRVVGVRFSGGPPRVGLTLALEQGGVVTGTRRLGPFADCGTAIDAAALAIALVIDPFAAPPPSNPPQPPPSTPPPPAPPRPLFAPRRAPVAPPPAWALPPVSVGLGAAGGVGIGFGVAPGAMGLVRVHLDAVELPVAVALGGRVDLPPPLVIDGTRRLESVGGAFFFEGCARLDPVDDVGSLILDLCALGEAGGLRAVAIDFVDPVEGNASLVTAGAVMTARVPLWSALGVFVRVGASVPVVQGRLVSGGATLWESPLVTGQLTVGMDGLAGRR